MTVEISPRSIARYAGASNDFNPLHLDESYAQDAGYDSVIAMGMYTAGIAGTLLNRWIGVEYIELFDIRFQDVVYAGDEVTVEATVEDSDEDSLEVSLTVTNQEDTTVLRGSATASNPR